MLNGEDWLQDPLMEIGKGSYQYHELKSLDERQSDLWHGFHFATRLKLEGADFFCRQALGAASMPDDQGMHLLAYKQLEWYLDAFFFELMSANDTLLQELNIIFAYNWGFKPKDVRWSNKNRFMEKLPEEIFNHIEAERQKDWFGKVQWYRNTATHHRRFPTSFTKTWWGNNTLDASHHVSIDYRDKEGNFKSEEIEVCKDYLKNMVRYISSVWEKMAQEFE